MSSIATHISVRACGFVCLLAPLSLSAQPAEEWFEPELLLQAYPPYQRAYNKYMPDEKIMQQLSAREDVVEVIAFYGIWCRDSRREIPRLLKVMDTLAQNDGDFYLQLVPINREHKRLDRGRPLQLMVTPTLVVYINGREVGRIEERARPDTESALLRILEARQFVPDEESRYSREKVAG